MHIPHDDLNANQSLIPRALYHQGVLDVKKVVLRLRRTISAKKTCFPSISLGGINIKKRKTSARGDISMDKMTSEKEGKIIDVYVIPAEPPDKKAKSKSFWHIDRGMLRFKIHFFLYIGGSICGNAIFTLSDTACCESIQKSGSDFGKQRLWGAIAWGAIAPLAGFINDYTGTFLASWTLMAVMLLLFLLNISKLDLVKPHFSRNILYDVGSVFKSKEFLAIELVILMNGMATGMIWFYLIWFLRAIGGSEFLCGFSLTIQNLLGVIPFMFFSGWIIRKVGHFQILSAALLIYVIRFLWYSYLYNPWLVLPIEVTHGITFGLYYPVLASYGKMSSKPGAEAMTQSVIFSTHEGLGSGLGCVLSGIGFDYFGGHQTFFFASIFSACGLGLSIIMYFLIFRRQNGIVQVTFPIKSELGK
ncbi:major facilitator superfamily domain-containing protein 6 [Nephila pilipes]|uniref:Major facilitator superfamily domain-containing protein 6 n=1 Tax=Nephila pilipes TaxID=299642 RepID=A0A8X6ITK1_NEPPI|nr:major facilitator superfamily domain-containing protein 6 [Nephila pilipes]